MLKKICLVQILGMCAMNSGAVYKNQDCLNIFRMGSSIDKLATQRAELNTQLNFMSPETQLRRYLNSVMISSGRADEDILEVFHTRDNSAAAAASFTSGITNTSISATESNTVSTQPVFTNSSYTLGAFLERREGSNTDNIEAILKKHGISF